MRAPTEFQLEQLMHEYDPVKAHEYYIKTRKLKGRKKGSTHTEPTKNFTSSFERGAKALGAKQAAGKKKSEARLRQKKELQLRIKSMEDKLRKLEALIQKKIREEKAEDRKSKAKKERAAKERDKPKSAAEKAEIARENEKYRDKHKQELRSKSRRASGGSDGGSSSKKPLSERSSDDLKTLATKVKGQIEVAKQKLAAL